MTSRATRAATARIRSCSAVSVKSMPRSVAYPTPNVAHHCTRRRRDESFKTQSAQRRHRAHRAGTKETSKADEENEGRRTVNGGRLNRQDAKAAKLGRRSYDAQPASSILAILASWRFN